MEYFYSIYASAGEPDYVYTQADLSNAPGPGTDLLQLSQNGPHAKACKARLAEVIASEPVLGWQ
eukprot:16437155-Heterocapsa_arctica.AAC.1